MNNISRIINKTTCHLSPRFRKTLQSILANTFTTKVSDDNWFQIYRFPQIRLVAAFNRLKLYHSGLSVLAVPIAIGLEQAGHIPGSTSAVVGSLAATGLATLCIGSVLCKNVVGILYVNDPSEPTKLKLSYPDFWGKRKDEEVVITDMISPSNLTKFKWSPVLTITTGEKSKSYRLLGSFGEILEPDMYFSIFGRD